MGAQTTVFCNVIPTGFQLSRKKQLTVCVFYKDKDIMYADAGNRAIILSIDTQ